MARTILSTGREGTVLGCWHGPRLPGPIPEAVGASLAQVSVADLTQRAYSVYEVLERSGFSQEAG
jgi:hypothetical protein